MKQNKKQTYELLNSNQDFDYSDYLEFCEANDIEPLPEDSQGFYDWCADTQSIYYRDDLSNLNSSKLQYRTFVIEGSLGLWNGRTTIKPIVVCGIMNAINRCFRRSIHDLDATLDTRDGVIYVNAYHHDGTNSFILRMLNKNGEKWIESAIERWENEGGDEEFSLNNHYWTKLKSIGDIFGS